MFSSSPIKISQNPETIAIKKVEIITVNLLSVKFRSHKENKITVYYFKLFVL